MDWALKAAKKKLKNQTGGSRSIVESLNEFNDVMLKGHKEIEDVFYRSNDWLNMEMAKLGFPRGESITAAPVSPDKSVVNDDQPEHETDEAHNEDTRSNETEIRSGDHDQETGMNTVSANATNQEPVSVGSRNELRGSRQTQIEDQDNNHTNVQQQLILQPAITPKSLLGDDTGRVLINSSSIKRASRESSVTKSFPWPVQRDAKDFTATNEIKAPPTKDNEITNEGNQIPSAADDKVHLSSVTKTIRDRSQRRSNMFAPLPSKDPLIVQPTPSQHKRKINGPTTLPIHQEKKLKVSPLHIPANSSESRLKSPRYQGNVFERLSNNLTESFERKAADRRAASPVRYKRSTTSPTRSQRSGASIHGSPTSRKLSQNNSHTERIHHTLKNIFDSKIPQLAKHNKKEPQPLRRRVSNLIDRSKPTERKSLIPRIKELTPVKGLIRENITQSNETNNIRAKKQLPEEVSQPPVIPQLSTHKSTSISPTSSDQRTNSHDRLTRFQLITGSSSNKQEKDTLKQKLNKRLSEVMRNQQEQQMRKKYELQQRRISQADEDTKRRTKILLDRNNATLPPLSKSASTNSMLHDINTVDYREYIGAPPKTERTSNDVTLPEIISDDEGNNQVERTLTSWAEPEKLKQQLLLQQNWDIEQILGPIPPLHIDEIFQTSTSRLQKLKKR